MEQLVKEDNLLGIRFWAQWKPIGVVPAYEIFEYIGSLPSIGAYVFRGWKDKTKTITKGLGQLNVNGFKPFCLDMAAINANPLLKGLTGAN